LVKNAGIDAAVERCGRLLEQDFFEDRLLPPLFTKARSVEQKALDARKFQGYRQRLRRIIFEVPDVDLRRQLISLDRKFRDLKIKSFQRDLAEARRSLNRAKMPDPYAGLFAAAFGAVWC